MLVTRQLFMFQSLKQFSIGDLFVTWDHTSGLVTNITYADNGKPVLITIGIWSDRITDSFQYTLEDLNRYKDEFYYYSVKK